MPPSTRRSLPPARRFGLLLASGDVALRPATRARTRAAQLENAKGARRGERAAALERLADATRGLLRLLYGDDYARKASTADFQRAVFVARARGAGVGVECSRRVFAHVAKRVGIHPRQTRWNSPSKLASDLAHMRPVGAQVVRRAKRVFALDLCSGTSSFERFVVDNGLESIWTVITCDYDVRRSATWLRDVTDWRSWLDFELECLKERFPEFEGFHYIHFSPECTDLSASKTRGARDIASALWLVQCGMALIIHLAPYVWTIESSASGAHQLSSHELMRGLDSRRVARRVHFCKVYGHGNWKPGQWWTNIDDACLTAIKQLSCSGASRCIHKWSTGRHRLVSQNGAAHNGTPGMSRDDCMAFPPALCEAWLTAVTLYIDRIE